MPVTVYNPIDGEIRAVFSDADTAMLNMHPMEICAEGEYPSDKYFFVHLEPQERPLLYEGPFEIQADGVDKISFFVPPGTDMAFQRREPDQVYDTLDDGLFEFSTAKPGTYRVSFYPPFPYQEQHMEIIAHG